MKATLQVLMILLSLGAGLVAFAGLLGLGSTFNFVGSEFAVMTYTAIGFLLIGLADSPRRLLTFRPRVSTVRMPVVATSTRSAIACSMNRCACPAA